MTWAGTIAPDASRTMTWSKMMPGRRSASSFQGMTIVSAGRAPGRLWVTVTETRFAAPRGTAALASRPANSSERVFMVRARLLHIPRILAIAFLETNIVGLAPQGTRALRRRWPNSVGSVGASILGRHLNPNRQVPRKFAGRIAGPPVVLGAPCRRRQPNARA